MAQASISRLEPEIHLQRGLGFLKEVERATDDFRHNLIENQKKTTSTEPFLANIVNSIRSSKALAQEKDSLWTDLGLAEQEIDRAAAIDHTAQIQTDRGILNPLVMRSMIWYMKGQIEMICGSSDTAIQFFNNSIQIVESPVPHYMLGIVYESKYIPVLALQHFEKCLELDPAGELSVSALREANAMRNYKKRFRGSWGIFLFLLPIWPVAIIYFFVKRK